jgi:2-keto-4-pentenoate hydratase/2-oxohepta-3-ene-1,7-dioic acid hydratase in catechol pathway
MNEVNARDIQNVDLSMVLANSFDTFAPLGPAIVTKDEVPDPHAPNIKLVIGRKPLQRSNTGELMVRIEPLHLYLLHHSSPTRRHHKRGTPSGVGLAVHLIVGCDRGETIITEIEGIGQLIIPVITHR